MFLLDKPAEQNPNSSIHIALAEKPVCGFSLTLFYSQQYDYRENVMLQNIYNYSKENQYNKAVFLIGAEHQRSIVQKIKEHEKLSEIKLNWTM